MTDVPAGSAVGQAEPQYGPYLLCGWKVWSALPLPELPPWASAEVGSEETRLLLDNDPDEATREFRYACEPDGSFLLQLPGLATYRVSRDAATVHISPCPCADAQLMRAHFYGSIVAVLCFLRGLLPLHGACVRVDDAAIIFTGVSGRGKSTMAAAFARCGYPVLCDDVCAIDLARGRAAVRPAFPRLKLLPDAIEAFSLDRDTLYTQAARGRKGHFLLQGNEGVCVGDALPIAAIYLLEDSSSKDIVVRQLQGTTAFLTLMAQVHRSNMGAALGRRDRNFRDLSRLLQSVPVFELKRPRDLTRIDVVVQTLAERHRQMRGPSD